MIRGSRAGGPLAWLGTLALVYLAVPVIAFLVRLSGTSHPGFGTAGLFPALGVSAEGATISTGLVALFGIPLAWFLARSRSVWARAADALVLVPLAIPPLVSGILLIYVVGPYTWLGRLFDHRLTDSLIGLVLAQTFVAAPFLIVSARAAFAAEDRSFEDVAATLGLRPLRRFLRVGLPGAATGIEAGLLLTWLRAFGEFGATVLVAYHPTSLPVYTYVRFSGTGLADTAAPTALALAVAAVAVGLSRLPRPRRRSSGPVRPEPVPPSPAPSVAVTFDLAVRLGSFDLRAAHRSTSHRLAIVGPSGSGKSLSLRSLGGLLGPGVGRVLYGEEDVSRLPAEDRRVGYVPQGYHLLPHLEVWNQVCFGHGSDPGAAAYWLDAFGLGELIRRRPSELSGGQRQRVALAQALARRPRLLLLDEPFSALDAPVRSELAREMRRLQRHSGLSTVIVTHDAEEAALLADEILVLVAGRLVQAGSHRQLLEHPASPDVAALLGISNVLEGRCGDNGRLHVGPVDLGVAAAGAAPGDRLIWCVHPRDVVVGPDGRHPAEMIDMADLGPDVAMDLRLADGQVLTARGPRPAGRPSGGWRVDIRPEAVTVWPADAADRPTPVAAPAG